MRIQHEYLSPDSLMGKKGANNRTTGKRKRTQPPPVEESVIATLFKTVLTNGADPRGGADAGLLADVVQPAVVVAAAAGDAAVVAAVRQSPQGKENSRCPIGSKKTQVGYWATSTSEVNFRHLEPLRFKHVAWASMG